MKIYLQENYKNNIDHYIKILKKKLSFEGVIDTYKRQQRFMPKCKKKQLKRQRKHLFLRHLNRESR
jgi:ribosomal protein S21